METHYAQWESKEDMQKCNLDHFSGGVVLTGDLALFATEIDKYNIDCIIANSRYLPSKMEALARLALPTERELGSVRRVTDGGERQ